MSRRHHALFGVGLAASLIGLLLACTGEDADLSGVSVGSDASDTTDANDASVDVDLPCDPAKDFGDGVPVPGLATPESVDYDARFSPDERVVYFTRLAIEDAGAPFTTKIYTSSRASRAVGFDAPQLVPTLMLVKANNLDDSPTVTGDGVTVFFQRSYQVWQATGSLAPEPIPGEINRNAAAGPYVVPDGSAIYFVKFTTTADGGTSPRIHRAGRGKGSYSVVTAVAGLPEGEGQAAPVVTPDELTIYWTARVGNSADVLVATRQDTASPFSGIHAVASVNTTARDEAPTFISADGCRLYYASTVHPYPAPDFASDIFVATKPR